ncbi:hypothetical protein [Pseudonocardia phyllosphaerae]|uniref:hypothetical protein n=1 Tax=Pseudonocardia phyllosphaerae TaxID=3390502 RepID=UPI00397C5814
MSDPATSDPATSGAPPQRRRLDADWGAVLLAAVLVLLAVLGLLPSIPFLIS